MRKEKIPFVIVIIILGSILSPSVVHLSHAATGEVCLADPSTSPCPASPAVFAGPVGQEIRIGVFISASDGLDGFDTTLLTNHTVLAPVRIDLTGSVLLGTPTIVDECLQGFLIQGSTCANTDTIDTIHLAAASSLGSPLTTAPTTGLLFTAIYNITGITSGISLGFQTGCLATSVANTCVTIANGSPTPNSETVQTGTTFRNSASAPMASVVLSANVTRFGPQFPGVSNTDIVTATARNGFPGTATDSVAFADTASPGLTVTIGGTNPCSTLGTSCTVSVTLTATAAGNFVATITGTYSTVDSSGNPDTLVSSVTIKVAVVDFGVSVSTASISFVSGSQATDTLTLTSQNGFSGVVSLTASTVVPAGLNITFSSQTLTLFPGGVVTSNATFRASPISTTIYHAIIRASSGSRIKSAPTITISVSVSSPDFTITASPSTLTIRPQATGLSTITVTPFSGFKGIVSLTTTISPTTGLLCTLNPTSINTTGTSSLRCSSAFSGSFSVTITATSGTLTHSTTLIFIVSSTADFSLSANPNPVSTSQGVSGMSIVTVTAVGGFNSSVILTAQASTGLTCTLTPGTISISGTSTLSCAGSLGNYTVTVTGISGSLVHTLTIFFNVNMSSNAGLVCVASTGSTSCPNAPPLIGLSNASQSQLRVAIVVNSSSGLDGFDITVVTNSTILKPAGVDLANTILMGTPVTLLECVGGKLKFTSGTCSSTDTAGTIHLVAESALGSPLTTAPTTGLLFTAIYNVTGTTSGTTIGFQAGCTNTSVPGGFCVTIANGTPTPNVESVQTGTFTNLPTFSLQSPIHMGPIILAPGSSSSFTLNLTRINGFTGVVTITTNVSPSGPTVTVSPTSVQLNATNPFALANVAVSVTPLVAQGNYTLTVRGTSGTVSHALVFAVIVTGPDFAVSLSPPNLALNVGQSGVTTVIVTSLAGFSGTIAFASAASQSGLSLSSLRTVSLLPSGTNSSSLIVRTSNSTLAGTYTVTITGTAGAISHTVILTVNVEDFRVTIDPASVSLQRGGSGLFRVQLQSLNSFSGTVSLTASQSPSVTAGLGFFSGGPFQGTLSIGISSNQNFQLLLQVTAATNASPGNYTVTVTGTGPWATHTVAVLVVVVVPVPPPPDFTISASPSFLSVPAGSQGNSTITLQSLNGFHGNLTVSYQIILSPGITIILRPSSVLLLANVSRSATLLISTSKTTPPAIYTITVIATNQTLSHAVQVNLQVLPPPDIPPTAIFTFTPSNPIVGQDVVFNGTSSFDPDGFVRLWTWNFGDGSGLYISTTPLIDHTFFTPGNYSVLLTVQDNVGLTGSKSATVKVIPRPMHDVSILGVFLGSQTAVASQRVVITVYLRDDGTSAENVSVTVYANGHAIQTLSGLYIQNCGNNCFNFLEIVWDTTNVAPGQYTISATIFLPQGETDPTPQDNTLTDGTITVLPSPVIVAVPASGTVGAKIVVEGSGFPLPNSNGFGPPFDVIEVTFDDMNLGFVVTSSGTFNFTLDVPLAQPGPHQLKALDEIFGAHTTGNFQVLPNQASIVVTVNTGAVYFPGDMAAIYVLTSVNGAPTSSNGLQLQLMLVYPNGTLTSLKAASVSPGLYKATFAIPKTGPLGTYSLVATAQAPDATGGVGLGGFEVQRSWLSSHASSVAGGTAIAGVFGFAAFAWHKGYFRKKNDNEPRQPEERAGMKN